MIMKLSLLGLFDDGQEYKYTYLAYTTTGVRDPEATSSSFGINGQVVVQKKNGEAIVKVKIKCVAKIQRTHWVIVNMKWNHRLLTPNSVCTMAPTLCLHQWSSWRNPNLPFWRNPSNLLTPTERYGNFNTWLTTAITSLFWLNSDVDSFYWLAQVSGFAVDSSDVEWSVNIKKGLATTLQVDHSTGDEFGKDRNAFMRTVEVLISTQLQICYIDLTRTTWSFRTLWLVPAAPPIPSEMLKWDVFLWSSNVLWVTAPVFLVSVATPTMPPTALASSKMNYWLQLRLTTNLPANPAVTSSLTSSLRWVTKSSNGTHLLALPCTIWPSKNIQSILSPSKIKKIKEHMDGINSVTKNLNHGFEFMP